MKNRAKYTKRQIKEAIAHWKKQLDEASADDILARWNSRPKDQPTSPTATVSVAPKKFTSYQMGNDTHELYAGDWIFGMYMQKDDTFADYAIYRMSRINAEKFKALKGKTQTSTLKSFLTRNAEKIEGEEHGRWTLDKFIAEMKRLVGDAHYGRQPVLFTAGLLKTNYHYSANPRHRGKTTFRTQTTGHITYDLDDFKFDGSRIDNYSGKTKAEMMHENNERFSKKETNMKTKYTKRQIKEAIAHWTNILESIDNNEVDETEELNEDRSHAIRDAFNTLYKDIAVQLQAEQSAEMEQWKKLVAAHQAKMEDIKRRRVEALANFRSAQAQLKRSGVSVDDGLDAIADTIGDNYDI